MLRTSCIVPPTDPVAHDKLRRSDLNTKSIASTLTDTSLKQPSHSQISTLFLPYILKIKIPQETPRKLQRAPPRLVEKGQETKIWESLLHEWNHLFLKHILGFSKTRHLSPREGRYQCNYQQWIIASLLHKWKHRSHIAMSLNFWQRVTASHKWKSSALFAICSPTRWIRLY
jgi:hypothetical protein